MDWTLESFRVQLECRACVETLGGGTCCTHCMGSAAKTTLAQAAVDERLNKSSFRKGASCVTGMLSRTVSLEG